MLSVDFSTSNATPDMRPPDLTHEEDAAHSRAIAAQYSARASTLRYVQDDWDEEDQSLRMFLIAAPVGIFRVKVPVS